jgi:hypothetical protein
MDRLRQLAKAPLHAVNEFTFEREGARIIAKYRFNAISAFPKAGNLDFYAFLASHGLQTSAMGGGFSL